MGRLIAFILGGAALALYAPNLFLSDALLTDYTNWWTRLLGKAWHQKIFDLGPGIFAGLALILIAIRGKD